MTPGEHRAVADFARAVLGCRCEPEVFRTISLGVGGIDGLPCARVVIGERLLIWLARGPAAGRVAELAAAGIRDRDAAGYNRFRLVLADAGAEAEAGFAAATGSDAKAHLHLVPEPAWPAVLRALA